MKSIGENMKKSRILFLSILLFLFVPLASYAQSATNRGNTAQTFNKTFRGKLGEPIDVGITMKLKRNGKSLSGTVFDESTKKTTKVRGTISANGRIKLSEFRGAKRTGTWEGRLDSPNQFSGSYSPVGDGDSANFTFISR